MLPVLVASKPGVIPGTTLSKASFRVTLIAIEATPSAMVGPLLTIVDFVLTEPGKKVTVVVDEIFGRTTWSVLISALVDFNVQVEIPAASDDEQLEMKLLVPLAVKLGTTPETGVAPLKVVMVIVEASVLLAM